MSKHSPFSPKPGSPSASDQALQRAALALQMQRPGEAERLAAGVLKASRGNVAAAVLLARALMLQNRADEAIPPLERAARRGNNPSVETLLATALAAVGRRDEAQDLLRQATARRPPFPPAFVEYANQLAAVAKFDEAIAVLEDGLAMSPDIVDLQFRLASLYIGRNNRTEARTILLRAAAAAPARHDILAELARVMALDGEYAAAAETYRRVLALRPDHALSRANLGVCLMEMGDRDAGQASLREAMRGRPEMFGRAILSLAATAHGRFFFRPSAAAKFLQA